jgi:hypothetical protein
MASRFTSPKFLSLCARRARSRLVSAFSGKVSAAVRAAFPKGNPYLTLRDQLGTIFQDEDFATLFPAWGYPGLPPWRLALVTLMQFRENLADRQAAEAVRARLRDGHGAF